MRNILTDIGLTNINTKNAINMFTVNAYATDVRIGTDLNFKTFAKEGYSQNSLVYACLSKTAGAAANISFNHVDKDGNDVSGELQELLLNPNPYQTQTQFIQTIILHRRIAGISYWEVERTQAGKPKYLWPLRPDWVKKRVGTDGIEGYLYKPEGEKKPRPIEANNVIEFKAVSPTDPLFSGQSALEPIAGIIDTDHAITSFLSLFFEKGANPTGYIVVKKPGLTTEESEKIADGWLAKMSNWRNWLRPAVLSEDAEYKQIGSKLNELNFDVLDARNEARICMALDVPPIMVGAQVGLERSTYSNYREARQSWWEDTLIPMFDSISDDLNRVLLKLFNANGKITIDTSRVIALKEDRTSSWDRAQRAYAAGLITKNQALEEMGLPTVSDGDEYIPQQRELKASKPEDDITNAVQRYFGDLVDRVESNI